LVGIPWSSITFRQDCRWTSRTLAGAALLWAWSDELTLGERFRTVRRITMCVANPQQQLARTYQAFMKMLQRWTDDLVELLVLALRGRMQETLWPYWRVSGVVLFGVDGSRIDLPRTRSHEDAYSIVRHRRRKNRFGKPLASKDIQKANSPQLWLTTMWHAGSGLPWDWRSGPADSNERAHLQQMLAALPAGALVAADAGFVGYAGLSEIVREGFDVLLRVGSNVRLLQQLGWVREAAGTVYLWPEAAWRGGQAPLTLRLVTAHNGKHPVYLVTSVLSPRELTDRQVVELYAKRWGIELFYRHLKHTFQRRKLLSTSAANARLEIQWSLVGLWAMALYALSEATHSGTPPDRLSFAKLLLAFRRTMRDYLHPAERDNRLCQRLRRAVIDPYIRRNKESRNHPRKKKERPPSPPIILLANALQKKRAQTIKQQHQIRLTA
jgi:IS4 transposase